MSDLADWLKNTGHEARSIELRLAYDRAVRAQQELNELQQEAAQQLEARNRRLQLERAQLDRQIADAEAALQKAKQELDRFQQEADKAYAKARFPFNPREIDLEAFSRPPDLPEERAVAGGEGLSFFERVGESRLFTLLAPAVIGTLLAICLGTLTGLIELSDFNRLNVRWPKFVLAGLLGSSVVYLMGAIGCRIGRIVARHILDSEVTSPKAIRRWVVPVALFLSVIALLVVLLAEVAVEAAGVRELNLQHLADLGRWTGVAVESTTLKPLSWWVCVLIGTLMTSTYLGFKLTKTLDDCGAMVRENYVRHKQWEFAQQRLKESAVGEAMQAAHDVLRSEEEVKRCQEQVEALKRERPPLQEGFDEETKLRFEDARAAASGEADRFYRMAHYLVEVLDPLPSRWSRWWTHWKLGRRSAGSLAVEPNMLSGRDGQGSQEDIPARAGIPASIHGQNLQAERSGAWGSDPNQ